LIFACLPQRRKSPISSFFVNNLEKPRFFFFVNNLTAPDNGRSLNARLRLSCACGKKLRQPENYRARSREKAGDKTDRGRR
jgi:hypothetical protein